MSMSFWQTTDGNGTGLFAQNGKSDANSAMGFFVLFYNTQTVEPYSCKRLKWTFWMRSVSNYHRQAVGLYALNGNLSDMQNLTVDCTQAFLTSAGRDNRIGSIESFGSTQNSNDFYKTFDFDNRNGSTAVDKTWSLMLTLVIGNAGSSHSGIVNAGLFKSKTAVWETLYYKHISFQPNGGGGIAYTQTIENGGNLIAHNNRFSRSGFVFNGWNTQPDGNGITYADGAYLTASASDRGNVTLYAQWIPKPSITKCAFLQRERKVRLEWNISAVHKKGGCFVVYRGNTKIGTVPCSANQTVFAFEDTNTATTANFPYESNVGYSVYFVANGWDENTRRGDLVSTQSVSTTRSVPIINFQCLDSDSTRVICTWTSDGYETNWGNQFKIYIDDETEPVITLRPFADGMTSFRWEHRSVDSHTNRQNFVDSVARIWYTEDALDACSPHTYTIVGVVDNSSPLSKYIVEKKSIAAGTAFESLEASKAAYAGKVKLAWQVNLRGSTSAKTYSIYRRRAERMDESWTKLDNIVSDQQFVTYTDDTPQTGLFYEYKVVVTDKCEDGSIHENLITDIGFAKTTGTINGRVTYGSSGMAVAGVDVIARQVSDGDTEHQFYSLYFNSYIGRAEWTYPDNDYAQKVFGSDFSMQFWAAPDDITNPSRFVQAGTWTIGLNADGKVCLSTDTTYVFDKVALSALQYEHLTISCSGQTVICTVVRADADGIPYTLSDTIMLREGLNMSGAKKLQLGGFTGYMDEFRLWTKVLTPKEILTTYDRILVGNEKNLEIYWTFDEGLRTNFFDYSRDGSVYRGHHGKHENNVKASYYVPSSLALKAQTDSVGNYIITGIPFAGEGTNYAIIPTLGIHQFNPTQQIRFISANSLVHNSTDFDDISSFPVSGKVLYAGTDYPVEGCNFYIDGEICSENGEPIVSNAYGDFKISVPIGEHFIQIKKQGHVFANNGRYPALENGKAKGYTFDREIKNLTFIDSTLVHLTGRVAGGDIQGDKPVGFGLSTNNIGAATITLLPQNSDQYRLNVREVKNETTVSYEVNPDSVVLGNASPDTIRSYAWRGAGTENGNKLFIRTDSATGEFSALVPPLNYSVTGIHVGSADLDVLNNAITLDMSNAQTSGTDSVMGDDKVMRYFPYHTKLVQTYHSEPTFTVTQRGQKDGAFGIDSIDIEDALGALHINDIHHLKDGAVEYTYGYPLFVMGDPYTFNMEGYEQYVNKDGEEEVYDRVPLSEVVVTIENALSDDQAVCGENNTIDSIPGSVYELKSNQLTLDSLGKATYTWHAGIPNITSPFTRTINIYYDIDDRHNQWSMNPVEAIVLGDMPTGTNFVTSGPDRVQMILRDPPGSGSSASWETGISTTNTKVTTKNISTDNSLKVKESVGIEMEIGAGLGVMVINKTKVVADATQGLSVEAEWKNSKSYSTTISSSKTISTSSDGGYVGAEGDVFIGTSTNILFGKVRNVALYRNTEDTTKAHVDLQDAISTGLQFKTCFSYTQKYIEEDLIPNLRMLRNACLTYAADPSTVTNTGEMPIYVTSLLPEDPNYGAKNTYRMIAPENATQSFCDTILYFNNQIANWENQLALNEKEKVEAYEHRAELESKGLMTNYSFDAGTSIEISKTVESSSSESSESSWSVIATLGSSAGFEVNGCGAEYEFEDNTGGGGSTEEEKEQSSSTTFSFSLEDGDEGDAITVDVYSAQGMFGSPIFRTRGGQTSNPYEGEVKTKYYQPGTTIMEATMQIEMPKIEVVQPLVTDVTSGTAANFELRLMNQSETNANCTFKLYVVDASNPHGAQLIMDGTPLTGEGRLIKVPYGETLVKSLQLRQSDVGILDYENIELVLASKHQGSIKDNVLISAQFVPSASPVALSLSTTTMNTQTGTNLVLTMKDFDRNYHNQKAFRLQYKPQGGDWTLFHEYVLHEEDKNGDWSEVLPAEGANIRYTLPMYDYSDGTYRFRIVSVSTFGTDEIYVYSDEITMDKNLSRPRPLGLAEPADGILDIGDELSITFNEEFVNGELTSAKNFLITGVLNGAEIEHYTALRMYDSVPEPTAATDAYINLSNKDFSINTWLYIQTDGTLLRHGIGANILSVGTNEDGQLTVAIGDSLFTSQTALPRNKWLFLAISYHHAAHNGELSAAVAYDDVTEPLFNAKTAPIYHNKGPLYVGGGAGAAMHELLLWDEARDIVTALAERDVTKNPATRHLIGYWKMNEGEGKTIQDYSRNRHMAMASESWYLNNINYAVTLDGTHPIAMSTATVPPMPMDDYAAEMWVRAGAQAGEAQLFQLGEVSMLINADGNLVLESNENQWTIANSQCLNNEWHHVMLNVRRLGTAAVYIDGVRALTVNAGLIGDLASDSLRIGRGLVGAIDEVRLWKTTIASDMLASKRKMRLNGDEPGLSLYYPFEKKGLDEYNQIVVSGTLEEMTGHGTEASLNSQLSTLNYYTDDAPALREKQTQQNVAFSFTASSTKIVIDIEEEPETIEGCTLNFTVRDVRSNSGNYSLPATWTAFVHRNELTWEETELTAVQAQSTSVTVSSAIINRSGTPQRWVLSDLPAWLTTNQTSGMLNPLEKTTVTFSVNEATPIGKYEQTIYASGNNGIETPLTLHLTVVGDVPEWKANPTDYAYSMDIIGQLSIFGVSEDDEDDIVAAFIDGECRGVAQPKYRERYDGYYLTLTIYGDATDNGKEITFRAYDASSGITYSQVTATPAVTYQALSLVGKYNEPVLLNVEDKVEQHIVLRKGWNWISLNVTTDNMYPTAILDNVADDVILIKGQTNAEGFLQHAVNGWTGTMDSLRNNKMYAVKMAADRDLRLVGKRVSPLNCFVQISENWNWIGYYEQQRLTVTDALAPMDPQDGDIIRSQRNISYYDDYEWVGSLLYMEPGAGYIVYSTVGDKQFAYPGASVTAHAPRLLAAKKQHEEVAFQPIDPLTYPYNMTLVAQVLQAGEPLTNTQIGIFYDDECRAVGLTDNDGMMSLLIQGEEPVTLTFKKQSNDLLHEAKTTLFYETDAIIGTVAMPFIISFDQEEGIEPVTGNQPTVSVKKVIENQHFYIIRNGDRYDAIGKKLTR